MVNPTFIYMFCFKPKAQSNFRESFVPDCYWYLTALGKTWFVAVICLSHTCKYRNHILLDTVHTSNCFPFALWQSYSNSFQSWLLYSGLLWCLFDTVCFGMQVNSASPDMCDLSELQLLHQCCRAMRGQVRRGFHICWKGRWIQFN